MSLFNKTPREKIERDMRRAQWMSLSNSKHIRNTGATLAANATTRAILEATKNNNEEK
jgi:hypothetical protein